MQCVLLSPHSAYGQLPMQAQLQPQGHGCVDDNHCGAYCDCCGRYVSGAWVSRCPNAAEHAALMQGLPQGLGSGHGEGAHCAHSHVHIAHYAGWVEQARPGK